MIIIYAKGTCKIDVPDGTELGRVGGMPLDTLVTYFVTSNFDHAGRNVDRNYAAAG